MYVVIALLTLNKGIDGMLWKILVEANPCSDPQTVDIMFLLSYIKFRKQLIAKLLANPLS
jgi:hypothetical protein